LSSEPCREVKSMCRYDDDGTIIGEREKLETKM